MDKRKSFKTEKSIISYKWKNIKEKSKSKDYDLEELNHLTCDLIAHLTVLTERGIKDLDGISINTEGKLRPLHLGDGWYVVGEGCLIPVEDMTEAQEVIKKLSLEE